MSPDAERDVKTLMSNTQESILEAVVSKYREKVYFSNVVGIMETVPDFIFLGSKITTDDDCNHEIERRMPLGEKL